jgi:hypothetical protein
MSFFFAASYLRGMLLEGFENLVNKYARIASHTTPRAVAEYPMVTTLWNRYYLSREPSFS